jgi:fucose 4-O-acetylase-like acetyltransferase
MILLLFVHSYNLNLRYLQPFTIVDEQLTFNSFIQYFFSNGLFRFFIPMLFSISGYLYATHDGRSYGYSIRKRFRSILLPYLIWSAVGLLLTYAIELTSYGRGIVETTHLLELSNHRILLHDYKWYELLARWILLPVPYQLWFLRVLFIYNLLYPVLRYCILNYTKVFFLLAILFWLSEFQLLLIEGEGLFFFSLGIWIQKRNFNIREPNKWLRPLPWALALVILAAIKTLLAFKGFPILGDKVFPLMLVLHKLMVFSGFITAWFGSDRLVTYCMAKRWFVWLSAFSFTIYGLHAPLVAYAINAIFPSVQQVYEYRLITYLFLPIALLIFCVGIGVLARTLLPKFYALATGGRGIRIRHGLLVALLSVCFFSVSNLKAQEIGQKRNQTPAVCGYTDKGDSVEFVFGQQQKITVGGAEVLLSKWIDRINEVNVAGDFNEWNPDAPKFQMKKVGGLFNITICKMTLGKKGETRQFKFVLNHKYWVEPPADAPNKFTGADKNTNLTLRL